jgi:hypothetical protein
MRAISLHQPWASLIAIRAKRIESRSWSTPYRGPLAIHAAKTQTSLRDGYHNCEPFRTELRRGGFPMVSNGVSDFPDDGAFPLGCIVAVCQLVTILPTAGLDWRADGIKVPTVTILTSPHERDFGDYEPGRFAWVLADVHRLPEPIPYRGQQGLWELEPEVVAQIEAQLGTRSHSAPNNARGSGS